MKLRILATLLPAIITAWLASPTSASGGSPTQDPNGKDIPPAGQEAIGVPFGNAKASAKGILAKLKNPANQNAAALVTAMDRLNLKVDRKFGLVPGLQRLVLKPGAAVQKLDVDSIAENIKELQKTGLYEYVEPDWIVQAQATPSDAAFADGSLWGLRNTGQSGGTPGADIRAVDAWNITTGSTGVVVAVIDTGIRHTHQDLAANMWRNPGESGGGKETNGIDDDANGFIDDVHGINAITGSGNPMDDNDHGSHCAGTIGAVANGGGPHVGVAWNVRLMGLKFLGTDGGYNSDAITCIEYAIAKGAKILSNSWGNGGYSQALYDSIAAARDAGVLFVAAAGNYSENTDVWANYPSGYDLANIVAVAALDRNDQLASFSNYGRNTVDLGAPGVDIYSCTSTSDTSYGTKSGTSMATPHVAGAAALLAAARPNANYIELKQRLMNAARPVSSMAGKSVTGAALNAHASLTLVDHIANGSFEDNLNFWTTQGNLAVSQAGSYPTTDGDHILVFNNGQTPPNAVVTQSFTTVVGENYTLNFDVGVLAYNTLQQRLRVTVESAGVTLVDDTTTVVGAGGGAVRWTGRQVQFTANSNVTLLRFSDVSTETNSLDLLLDYVRVTGEQRWNLTVDKAYNCAATYVNVSPPDLNGLGSGGAPLQRQYEHGQPVLLSAWGYPYIAGDHVVFSHWLKNGVFETSSAETTVVMTADTTMTPVFDIEFLDYPWITSPLTAGAIQGLPFEYRITATGYPSSFGASPLPPGLVLQGDLISGIPTQAGVYTITLTASNIIGSDTAILTLTVLPEPDDYLTEQFTGLNDTGGQSFTFVPDGSNNHYRVARRNATAFPTDPAGGQALSLSDDSFAEVIFQNGAVFPFFGESKTSFFVGSNGYVTFGSGDSDYTESLADHFAKPRIAALFDDLNPSAGGLVSWKQSADRMTVTFEAVPEYSSMSPNTFQIEMFFDGRIRITILSLSAGDGLIGLSRGLGLHPNFTSSDFSTYPLDSAVVSLFVNGSYVNLSREVINVQTALANQDYSSVSFTGTAEADWNAAFAAADVVAIPPLENSPLVLSAGAISAINAHLAAGKGLVVMGVYNSSNAQQFLNTLRGWSLIDSATLGNRELMTKVSGVPGFANSPPYLAALNATKPVVTASLPGQAQAVYQYGTNTAVFVAGPVAYLGFDWWESPDAAWSKVLSHAITAVVAPPTNSPVIISPLTATVLANRSFNYQILAAGLPSSYDGSGLPSGLSVNPATGLISGTVAVPGGYPMTISATNAIGTTTATLTLTVTSGLTSFFDDFDPGYDAPLWAAFGGTVTANTAGQAAGTGSTGNSLHFDGDGSRYALTSPIDTRAGGSVTFLFALANGSSIPWETADSGEEVVLEYSIDGEASFVQTGGPYSNRIWQNIVVPIPTGAQSAATQFRWRQLDNSGTGFDHWALDDVRITSSPMPEIVVEQPAGTDLTDNAATLAFGSVNVGSSAAPLTVTIRNPGTANLTGLAVSKTGSHASDFTLGAPGATTLAPGASTTFTVTFTPSAGGTRTAALQIASNDADENPFDIALTGNGVLVPEIVVEQPVGTDLTDNAATLAFGSVNVGSSAAPLTVTIRNPGTANLTGLAVSKTGSHASDFTLGAPGATTLAPGASTTFTVTFTPSAGGTRTAALQIASNDADENPFDIALTGNGVLVPEIVVEQPVGTDLTDNAATLAFGSVNVGSSAAPLTVTIRNPGTANLTGLAVSKTGSHASDFTLGAPGATTLAPGASTTFTVTFTPSAGGTRTAALQIASNDADENPFDIALTGNGVLVPEIVVEQPVGTNLTDNAATLAFGSANVGTSAPPLTVTIRNPGTANLTGLAVSKTGSHASDFTLGAPGATTLAPGASTTFTVTFTPSAGGTRTAALQIASNDADENPFDIALTGNGVLVPEIVVEQPVGTNLTDNAATLAFGSANVGTSAPPLTVTIRNPGTANLTGLAVSKTGSHASDFTLGAPGATTLAPGASTTFTVTFTPSAGGTRTAALQIASNDADENPFDIALTGNGVLVPEIVVEQPVGTNLTDNAATLAFGSANVGTSAPPLTVTIRNPGTANLTGLAVSKTGSHASDFTLGAPGATTLAPGASTTFTVTFTPSAGGTRTAALQIASNDADENPFDIALTGNGVLVPEIVVEQPVGTNLTDNAATLAFGSANVGTSAPPLTVTIRNPGTANLTGLAVSKTGSHASDFTLGAPGATTLAPGASTTFTVTFTPSAGGTRTAALQIASNDADENPFDIALTGTGVIVPEIVVEQPAGTNLIDNAATLAFGSANVDDSAPPLTVTIRNTGSANLTSLAVSKAGSDPADFAVGSLGAATLAPGASTTFSVTFTPGAAGPRTAALQIASNDADENPFDIALTGTGVPVSAITVVHSAPSYRPATNMVMTVGMDYVGQTLSALGYSLQLPTGWSYVSDTSTAGAKPAAGETGTIEWAWISIPAGSTSFSVTLLAPSSASGNQSFSAVATSANAQGSQTQTPAAPNPLSVPQVSFHTVDVDSDWRYELTELLSVISLYNYRDGSTRTGEFYRDAITYRPGPGTQTPPYHSTDLDVNWRVSLTELLSDISLYNYREGTVRTGEYHYNVTSGRFAPGPAPSGTAAKGVIAMAGVDLNATLSNLSGTLSAAGGVASLQVSLAFDRTQTSSLGAEFNLPPGWSMVSETTGTALVKPAAGQTGALEWAWSNIPNSPVEFVVTVNYPPSTAFSVITGIAIAADNPGVQTQDALRVAVGSDAYLVWADTAFAGAPGGVDKSPTGNPDLDGFNNLLECALGLTPMAFDPEVLRLQPPTGVNPLPNTLELSYERPAGGVSGFTYTMKSCNDLSSWEPLTGHVIVPLGGGREKVVRTVSLGTSQFYILEVTRP